MPRETIVDLPCRVKHELAPGDLRVGSRLLINLLRARDRIELVRARPRQDGKAIEDVPVRVPHLTAAGVENRDTTVGELERETARLDPLAVYCTNCPANARLQPFGCVGGLPYPIAKALEEYALERAAPPDRIGGALLLQTLQEQNADGSRTRHYRAEAWFEAFSAPTRRLDDNAYEKQSLNSDELFHPLLIDRGVLEPWMALNVLLWFDAIALDNAVPSTVNDVLTLTRLQVSERSRRTKCRLGPPAKDPRAEPFRVFLKLLYVGWSRDIEVKIES